MLACGLLVGLRVVFLRGPLCPPNHFQVNLAKLCFQLSFTIINIGSVLMFLHLVRIAYSLSIIEGGKRFLFGGREDFHLAHQLYSRRE